MTYKIPFNKPYIIGSEIDYIKDAVERGQLSGNGYYTKKCQSYFEDRYGFKKCLLTHSGTAALEMAALLLNIQSGDEVILPSYTFVSTANAFILRGAKLRFADSEADHPNISVEEIERLVNDKTKAIVVVHYAGHAVDLDPILKLCNEKGVILIEDAAHAIDSTYKGRWLGGIGHLSAFSFHETKNIISGEGGMLVINDERFIERSEILWEKGTNRRAFERGEVAKYEWVDVGSSYLPSELTAAFLFAQLEHIEDIQKRRVEIWKNYHEAFSLISENYNFKLPVLKDYASVNGHFYYIVCQTTDIRKKLIDCLKNHGIMAVFHYQALHSSPYFSDKYIGPNLPNAIHFTECLLRLPSYYGLSGEDQDEVIDEAIKFII